MAHGTERHPEPPGRSVVPVKPGDRSNPAAAVPPAWLADAEHLPEAERLKRLESDLELVNDLALAGFDGPDWEYFATELAKYGLAVIGGWMRRDLIFDRCRNRGYGVPLLERPFTPDEVEELSGETVAKALFHFRTDVLMKGKWDYRRGASLKTYFIGQCMIRFANVYRRWWGNEIRQWHSDLIDPRTEKFENWMPPSAGPENQAVAGVVAAEAMAGVKDPRVRKAMHMTAEGRTQAEIAEALGVTVKTVERMLANERVRVRRRIG